MAGRRARRRDFGELAAKLDKHIERLPEYAEKAQRRWQRYRPPQSQRRQPDPGVDRQPSEPRADGQRGHQEGPLARAAGNLPVRLPDLSVVSDVRQSLVRWNAPDAKLRRRKHRTSRAMTLWIVLTILCGIAVVVGALGATTTAAVITATLMPVAGVLLFGTFAVRAGLRLRTLSRIQVPAAPTPAALPAQSSIAYEPMRVLGNAESALDELLRQLSAHPVGSAPGVPQESITEARETSTEAARALRALAGRIVAVERARDSSPAGERAALDTAVRTLREQLDDGLEGYGGLVAAAGRAVAASSSGGVDAPKLALTDATDRLAGLAIALRELG